MTEPVEQNVGAAAAAYVGSAALLGVLVPTAITAVSGWKARHTPRNGSPDTGG